MAFSKEPDSYVKTAWSDLQGAWATLRESIVAAHPFPESDAMLFHVDEGMSWESVRNLESMRKVLLLIGNIAAQANVPAEVAENVELVREHLQEVLVALKQGKA